MKIRMAQHFGVLLFLSFVVCARAKLIVRKTFYFCFEFFEKY